MLVVQQDLKTVDEPPMFASPHLRPVFIRLCQNAEDLRLGLEGRYRRARCFGEDHPKLSAAILIKAHEAVSNVVFGIDITHQSILTRNSAYGVSSLYGLRIQWRAAFS
jgi:hypothetical protein